MRALCILAHEYAHALLGHSGPQSRWCEDEADRVAARLLISPENYARAGRLHGSSVTGIADELGVTVRLVCAYREALAVSRDTSNTDFGRTEPMRSIPVLP